MARLKQLHLESDFESLFWNNESCPLRLLTQKSSSSIKQNEVKRHVDMLQKVQEGDSEFFWQETAMSNLLAFLYLITGDDDLALEQLKQTLEKAPNNLNAIVGMTRIMESQVHNSEAERKIEQYRTLKEDDKEMEKQIDICRGEIAYACSFIGRDFYIQAIDRYEDLLHPESNVWTMKDELSGYIIRWQYYLAYTYNRMLNKGHKEKLAEKLGTKDIPAIFEKIFKLYDAVIRSDDVFHKGKAMIDLVDTYKKCKTSGNNQNMKFPYDRSPDQFVKDAMDAAPSDPHVLERCGRHYRQRAVTKKDFEQAIDIFDSLLKLHPSRHVAWHHMGLANRALWHIVGKYDEARLYNNSARKGEKKRVRKQKALECVETSRRPINGASATAVECYQRHRPISSIPNQLALCESPSAMAEPQSLSVDEGFHSMSIQCVEEATAAVQLEIPSTSQNRSGERYVDSKLQAQREKDGGGRAGQGCRLETNGLWHLRQGSSQVESQETQRRTAPRELPTLPPWKAQEVGHVPSQQKKRDFFDELRTNNPSAKEGRSKQYLQKAKECFEEAKKHSKGASSPYIVDLARSLISLGEHVAAESEFQAANKLARASAMNDNNATYLYEQWALLRHNLAKQKTQEEKEKSEMRDAASLYRRAILSAVRARERSRIAFYKLRDMLGEELKHDAGNAALKMEYSVLSNSVQNYGECNQMLLEALKEDNDTREIAWHLIKLLRERRHQHDAATAFMYLTALHAAEQLDLEDATTGEPRQESNRQLLINVVRELVREGDQTNADSGQTFGEIFRWMVGTRRISEYITLDQRSPRPLSKSGEICILAPSETTPGVDRALRLLQEVCGIVVVTAFCEGNCDISYGSPISEGLRAVVAISQAVVVVEDSTDNENWMQLFPILEELMKLDQVRLCLMADENTDCSNTEQRYIKRWPRLIIQQSCDDVELAYMLFTNMFP